ncbi:MAG: 30S ribosomal protein S18 [Myxococcaceae bacterium]|nr:30S ribosomal protein S18 [Myxococcaceae bacterium]
MSTMNPQGERSGGKGGGRPAPGGDRGDRGDMKDDEGRGGRGFGRRKVCRYCADRNVKVDFKDQSALKYFVTERGKIIPRRISGNCAKHQRQVAKAIKQARGLALIPYLMLQG